MSWLTNAVMSDKEVCAKVSHRDSLRVNNCDSSNAWQDEVLEGLSAYPVKRAYHALWR